MSDDQTLALCDLETVRKVQAAHDAECGYPKRHTHTMDGRPLPADVVIETRHAADPEPVLHADGKTVMWTHPLPAKPLKAEIASKVQAITAATGAQMKAAKVAKDKAEAEAKPLLDPEDEAKLTSDGTPFKKL